MIGGNTISHHIQFQPAKDLTDWVQGYHLFESGAFIGSHEAIAFPRHGLLINYAGPVTLAAGGEVFPVEISLHGVFTKPWKCSWQQSVGYIGVELVSTTTLHHLIRDSSFILTNRMGDIREFGLPVDNGLLDSLRAPSTQAVEKIALVEDYMRKLIAGLPASGKSRILYELEILKLRPFTPVEFEYSEGHLRREFIRHLGVSPKQYRDIVRVQRACQYLNQPQTLSHSQVAQFLDFHDAAHFNKVFKRYTNSTPSQYRMQCLENPLDTINHIKIQ